MNKILNLTTRPDRFLKPVRSLLLSELRRVDNDK
jgi:hypothetical protein